MNPLVGQPERSHRKLPKSWRNWSISSQLLLAVNIPLAIALGVLLALDYRREMADAVAQQHLTLNEEAMIVYHGLYFLGSRENPEAVQQYIDSMCRHKRESEDLGHHVAVRWSGGLIQAQPHRQTSNEMLQAMAKAVQAPNYLAPFGDESLIVGHFAGRGVDVYVSEYITSIRRSVRRNILFHLFSLVSLAIVAAAIVNAVLWRVVTKPVRTVSSMVTRVAAGEYDVPDGRFLSRELNELSDAVRTMSESLAANEGDRRAQMNKARRMQEHLMPRFATVPGLKIARLFAPADAVAGDYYDFVQLPDGSWLICVADVTGHGIPAALGSVILKAVLWSAAEKNADPGVILEHINTRLAVLLADQFASMFVGRWDPGCRQLVYASAGHEPGIVVSEGNTTTLEATGPLLGIDESASWETITVDFHAGRRLLLSTDGVAEACAPGGQLFGRERLTSLLIDSATLSPEDTVRCIRETVLEHQAGEAPTDDLTILLFESIPACESAAHIACDSGELLAGGRPT